jgi:acyl carrier protein
MNTQTQAFETLRAELLSMIIEVCAVENVNPSDVNPEDGLIGGDGALRLDSLDAVEIAVALQNRFNVKIKNVSSARSYFKSLNSLTQYIVEARIQ